MDKRYQFIVVALFMVAGIGMAQESSGGLEGRVVDSLGSPKPRTVILYNTPHQRHSLICKNVVSGAVRSYRFRRSLKNEYVSVYISLIFTNN
jgi:hypothetical protein